MSFTPFSLCALLSNILYTCPRVTATRTYLATTYQVITIQHHGNVENVTRRDCCILPYGAEALRSDPGLVGHQCRILQSRSAYTWSKRRSVSIPPGSDNFVPANLHICGNVCLPVQCALFTQTGHYNPVLDSNHRFTHRSTNSDTPVIKQHHDMPPKSSPTFEEFLLGVLANSEGFKTNWQRVADKYGYSRAADT